MSTTEVKRKHRGRARAYLVIALGLLVLSLSSLITQAKPIGQQASLKKIKGMPNVVVKSSNDPTRPVPGGVHWFGRDHQRNLQKTRDKNFKLCFLGDSITQGWPGDLMNKNFGRHKPTNFGIGGDRAENVLWRLNHGELAGTSPKVIVLLLGTNNSGMNTAGEVALGVGTVIQKLRSVVPQTKILLLSIFPVSHKGRNAVITEANTYLAKMDDGKWIHYLDINKNFYREDGTLRDDMLADGTHLTRLGYAMWGATTAPVVAKMMK
jgi:lysophospholipase L1-like esterase